MTTNIPIKTLLAAMLAVSLGAAPALAKGDKGGNHGEKHEKHEDRSENRAATRDEPAEKHDSKTAERRGDDAIKPGAFFNDDHRARARAYYSAERAQGRNCPPGLAKKNNGCMPPGQARTYAVGQPLPRDAIAYPVAQPLAKQLPAIPSGYRYVRVGNDVLLLSPGSGAVVDVIAGLLR